MKTETDIVTLNGNSFGHKNPQSQENDWNPIYMDIAQFFKL